MSQVMQTERQGEAEIFPLPPGRRTLAMWALAAGAALTLLAMVSFTLMIFGRTGLLQIQLGVTVPLLMAIGLFASAAKTLRGPREVRLHNGQLECLYAGGKARTWLWEEISFVKIETGALGWQRRLALYGTGGRVLLKLAHDFDRFDQMEAAINRRLAEHPAPGRAQDVKKKSRKTARWLMFSGIMACGLAGMIFWMASTDESSSQLMKDRGAPAMATVVKKLIAPDGRTRRIHYEVVDSTGTRDTANVEVTAAVWDALEVGTKVEVIAVPGRPDISRLASGQIDDFQQPSPAMMKWLSVAVAALGVLFFVGGIMAWYGREPKLGNIPI
jgi:hypothetical protein